MSLCIKYSLKSSTLKCEKHLHHLSLSPLLFTYICIHTGKIYTYIHNEKYVSITHMLYNQILKIVILWMVIFYLWSLDSKWWSLYRWPAGPSRSECVIFKRNQSSKYTRKNYVVVKFKWINLMMAPKSYKYNIVSGQ